MKKKICKPCYAISALFFALPFMVPGVSAASADAVYNVMTGDQTNWPMIIGISVAAGVAAIPPLVELVELVESLSFTPPAVEALPVGSVYLVSVVGGVYPKALVTFAFVRLIVPELTVMLLPIFTPPRVELVAAGSVWVPEEAGVI